MKSDSVSLRHPGPRNTRGTNECVPREAYLGWTEELMAES
jgi:hypothetical protein